MEGLALRSDDHGTISRLTLRNAAGSEANSGQYNGLAEREDALGTVEDVLRGLKESTDTG